MVQLERLVYREAHIEETYFGFLNRNTTLPATTTTGILWLFKLYVLYVATVGHVVLTLKKKKKKNYMNGTIHQRSNPNRNMDFF